MAPMKNAKSPSKSKKKAAKAPKTAPDLLMDQHREVEDLFQAIEDAKDGEERRTLCAQICDKLAIHAAIEEKIFYPGTKASETEEILLESVEEHLQIKRLIA